MDVLNFEDKGDSIGKGHVEEEEEEENEKDDKSGDGEVQDGGTGMISQAKTLLIGHSDVHL